MTGIRVVYITTVDGVEHAFAFLVEPEEAEPPDDREIVPVFEACCCCVGVEFEEVKVH